MARVNEDPYQLQAIMADSLLSILSDSVTLMVGVAFLMHVNRRMALVAISVLPVLVFLFTCVRTGLKEEFKEVQERSAHVHQCLADALSNVFTIKTLTLEKQKTGEFRGLIVSLIRQRFRIWKKRLTYETLIGILTSVVPIVVLWYGAIEISRGRLTVGEFIAFSAFLTYLYRPAEGIVISLLSMQSSVSAIERVFEILDTTPESVSQDGGARTISDDLRWNGTKETCPAIEFCDVSFRYPGKSEWVLNDVNFQIEQGTVVAVLGSSGAGKTTLANMIPRLLDVSHGKILVGHRLQSKWQLGDLRRKVAIVSQETRLFSTSVLENIRAGDPDAPYERVVEMARIACAHDFVTQLPQGYNTNLGETGLRLSAGQRQRLLLARAFLRNPQILILDEATSLLDPQTEQELTDNLGQWLQGRTLLVISHRPSLLSMADKVLSVRQGSVITSSPGSMLRGAAR